jgi:hypothetical protein
VPTYHLASWFDLFLVAACATSPACGMPRSRKRLAGGIA